MWRRLNSEHFALNYLSSLGRKFPDLTMNILRSLSLATLAAALVSPLLGMNNADVIKMKQADFSESTILMAIGKEPANYDTSPDALIELKKAGVSEAVIQKIVSVQAGDHS